MTEAAKEARRLYYRSYYQKNRERIQENKAAYWERVAKNGKEAKREPDEQSDKKGT